MHVIVITSAKRGGYVFTFVRLSVCPLHYSKSYERILTKFFGEVAWIKDRSIRIKYKLAVLTYKVRTTSTPVYLSRHIKLRDSVRTLRSATSTRLSEPFTSTSFAKRAFRCSAPATWNSLPRTVTDSNSIETFRGPKSRLKTCLYSLAYNGYWHCLPPAPLKLRPNGAMQIYYYYYYYYYYIES